MRFFKIHVLSFFLFFLAGLPVLGQSYRVYERDWDKNKQKISIISYNIFNGFDWGNDPERRERFVEWVKIQAPDILAMQELCGFTESKLKELAQEYGHPYVAIVKENGYPVGVTSKFPLEVISKNIAGYGHGMLHVRIIDMDVLITHLNPSDGIQRRQEAENIVRYVQENKLEKYLLMGDMNAFSPFDASVLDTRTELLKRTEKQIDNFDYSVIATFMAASMLDVCRKFVPDQERYTFPTRILTSSPKGEAIKKQQERIDYIFASPALFPFCVDAHIYNGADTDYLSDHYPIRVDLRIQRE